MFDSCFLHIVSHLYVFVVVCLFVACCLMFGGCCLLSDVRGLVLVVSELFVVLCYGLLVVCV